MAALAYWVWHYTFNLPETLTDPIRQYARTIHNTDFSFESLTLNLSQKRIDVSELVLRVPGQKPFLEIPQAEVFLASGTGVYDLFCANTVIERVCLKNPYVDITAPFPSSEEGAGKQSLSFPASALVINGIRLNTSVTAICIPDFVCGAARAGDSLSLECSFENAATSGTGVIKAMLDLTTGDSNIALQWRQNDFSAFLPLIFLWRFNGLNVAEGSANIDLRWKGNLMRRISNINDLGGLINKEILGFVSLKNCRFHIFGDAYTINADAKRLNASESWQIETAIKAPKNANLLIKAIYKGVENNKADFDSEFFITSLTVPPSLLKKAGVEKQLQSLGTIAKGMGTISCRGQKINSSGSCIIKGTKYKAFDSEAIDIKWALNDALLLKLDSAIKTSYGSLNAEATLDLSSSGIKTAVFGSAKNLNLTKLNEFLPIPIKGLCSGSFKALLDLDEPEKVEYEADYKINNGQIFDFAPSLFSGKVCGKGGSWRLLSPTAQFENNGEITSSGTITQQNIDLKIDVKNVDLTNFSVPKSIASGTASLQGTLLGAPSNIRAEGLLISQELLVEGESINVLRSGLSIKDNTLSLAPLSARAGEKADLDGYLVVDLNNGKITAMNLNFQRLPADKLKSFLPSHFAQAAIEGFLSGNVAYKLKNNLDCFNILIDSRDIKVWGNTLDTLYFEGSTAGKKAEVSSFFLRGFGGTLSMSGEINNYTDFSGAVEAEDLNLKQIPVVQKYLPNLRGKCSFQGSVDFSDEKRSGNFTLFAADMNTANRDLGNFGAEIEIDDDGMRVENGEFDTLGINIDANVSWAKNKPFEAELRLKDLDLSFISEAHGIKAIDYGGFVVNGICRVEGSLDDKIIDKAKINLDELVIKKGADVIVSNKPVDITYQNDNIEIRSLELKYKLGLLSVEGLYAPQKTASIALNGKDFSLKALGRLLNLPDFNYDGDVSLGARLFGETSNLQLKADANIANLSIGEKRIPAVSASIEASSSSIKIGEALVTLPTSSFKLTGAVGLKDFSPSRLDISLEIPSSPLDDIKFYFPNIVREAKGRLEGKLTLSGPAKRPKIIGDFHLNAESAALCKMKTPFKNIEIALSTSKNIVTLDKFSALSGHGLIKGSGQIDFNNDIGSLSVNISGEKLDIGFAALDVYGASAAIDISGDLYNPIVYGKILIPRARFALTKDLFEEQKPFNFFFETLKYKFEVEAPRNFWVKHAMLNAEMKGKFVLSGDLNGFNLDGGIDCVKGDILFQRRKFKIDTAEMRFGGIENSFDPHIFVKSEGHIQSTKVFLTLQGTMSSFTPKLYSTPPMEEGDLLALLTFGRNLNETMKSDPKDLFENEILEGLKNTYISAFIGSTISDALDLDELYLTSLQDSAGKTRSFIRVGKYFNDSIFMAYEGTMKDGEQENYLVEYHLPKGFVVNLEFKEPDKEQVVGIRYDWKF